MNNAANIAKALGGFKVRDNYLCKCVAHNDETPSLSLKDGKDGSLIVHCFVGCKARDIYAALRRRGLLCDNPEPQHRFVEEKKPEPIYPNPEALAFWDGAEPIEGTKGETYLRSRAIDTVPPSLRFLPDYEHVAGSVYLPAMVAALQAGDSRIIAVQITLLNKRGDGKASVKFPRKTFGKMHDSAVRLGPADEVLGLAEGVETGLSAMQLFGIPTWCCLGAQRMASVTIPDSIREIHIFADADEAGRKATAAVVAKNKHRKIIAHYPKAEGSDWNAYAMSRASHKEFA